MLSQKKQKERSTGLADMNAEITKIQNQLKGALSGYIFEPNTESTKEAIKNHLLRMAPSSDVPRIKVISRWDALPWYKKVWKFRQRRNLQSILDVDIWTTDPVFAALGHQAPLDHIKTNFKIASCPSPETV